MKVWAVIMIYKVSAGDCGDTWAEEIFALYDSEIKAINSKNTLNTHALNRHIDYSVVVYEVL